MSEQPAISILLVDDEMINLENVRHFLEQQEFQVTTATDGAEAISLLQQYHFDLVITDLKMGDIDGVQVMNSAKELQPDIEVIIITGYATVDSAVDVMAQGAFYYLSKPIKLKELHALVLRAIEKTMLLREISRLKQRIKTQQGTTQFIGQTPAILELKDAIVRFAQLDCNILITGETGSGKEFLFAHEKNAYTDAGGLRRGLLESANGGMVLFDEIGEMPLAMQVKLLRVLQERKIIRVGGTKEIPIDIRVLAATNRDLMEEVRKKTFRQDLYYRLNVVNLHIPPLRERKDDIPLLVNYFLAKHPPAKGSKSISREALRRLMRYDYPGNARELENIIERSLALCDTSEIQPYHLPADLGRSPHVHLPKAESAKSSQSLDENERDYILSVLKSVDGNKTQAAKIIGIDRVSLWRKLKRYENNGVDIG